MLFESNSIGDGQEISLFMDDGAKVFHAPSFLVNGVLNLYHGTWEDPLRHA